MAFRGGSRGRGGGFAPRGGRGGSNLLSDKTCAILANTSRRPRRIHTKLWTPRFSLRYVQLKAMAQIFGFPRLINVQRWASSSMHAKARSSASPSTQRFPTSMHRSILRTKPPLAKWMRSWDPSIKCISRSNHKRVSLRRLSRVAISFTLAVTSYFLWIGELRISPAW